MKKVKNILITALFCSSISLFAQDTLTLYFANNSDQLTLTEEKKLALFALRINKNQIQKGISIHGYADYVGNEESNQILSEKRATSVKNQLIKKGMNPNFVSTSIGFGKSNCNHTPMPRNGCQEHRKVNIIYANILMMAQIKKPEVVVLPPVIEEKETTVDVKTISNTEVGETLLLDNINFVGGQDIWLEESVPALEKLLETLLENSTLEIEIQGHICCDTKDRQDLSTKRAFAIYSYLINNGVEKKRLKYKGFGRTRPLLNNSNEIRNRRVEILILHK